MPYYDASFWDTGHCMGQGTPLPEEWAYKRVCKGTQPTAYRVAALGKPASLEAGEIAKMLGVAENWTADEFWIWLEDQDVIRANEFPCLGTKGVEPLTTDDGKELCPYCGGPTRDPEWEDVL